MGSIAIIAVSAIGYKGIETQKQNRSYITTNGLSDRYVVSDSIIWKLRVEAEADNIKEAQERVNKNTEIVLKFLKSEGIKEEEITSKDPHMCDRYRNTESNKNGIPRFEALNIIVIRTKRLEQVEKAKDKTIELLGKGINIYNELQYSISDIAKLKIEMIQEATLDSENRAKIIAKTLGTKITGPRNLSTGRFNILPADLVLSSDYCYDGDEESSRTKRIRVIVTGTYNMNS